MENPSSYKFSNLEINNTITVGERRKVMNEQRLQELIELRTKFKEIGAKLIKQYSDIVAIDSMHLNGEYTLGENIGDLGGVQAAYEGLQIFLKKNGRPADIDGFTAEQRFFMSWATVWRTLSRPDALETQIKTDPHSPGIYRATQPLKNIDEFYEAFGIKEGDAMYLAPEKRVRIW